MRALLDVLNFVSDYLASTNVLISLFTLLWQFSSVRMCQVLCQSYGSFPMIFLAPDASTGKRKKVHPEKKNTTIHVCYDIKRVWKDCGISSILNAPFLFLTYRLANVSLPLTKFITIDVLRVSSSGSKLSKSLFPKYPPHLFLKNNKNSDETRNFHFAELDRMPSRESWQQLDLKKLSTHLLIFWYCRVCRRRSQHWSNASGPTLIITIPETNDNYDFINTYATSKFFNSIMMEVPVV